MKSCGGLAFKDFIAQNDAGKYYLEMINSPALKNLQAYMFRTDSNHPAVRALKTFLNGSAKTQTSNLTINNLFDAQTAAALAEFQKNKGLVATGRMDFKTWLTIGAEMQMPQIRNIAARDATLRDLLELGQKQRLGLKSPRQNNAVISNKVLSSGRRTVGFPQFTFRLFVSAFAPFKWFGPFNFSEGDGVNRRFGVDLAATYRIRGESKISAVDDGTTFPYSVTTASIPTISKLFPLSLVHEDKSECHINDPHTGEYQPNGLYSEKSGVEYHMYGNDDAFFHFDKNPISDIDVYPTAWFTYEPQANPNNVIMRATGGAVGDQFPAVEMFLVDRKSNGVMLGVFQINAKDTPQWKLPGNNRLPMITFDLKIMVESGIFTGVFKNDRLISLAEHNSYYTNLPTVTGLPYIYPPERVRPATHY